MPLEIPARTVAKITCLALSFLACLMVAGCAPKDPLDWKIEADTPADFDDWWQQKKDLLPPSLAIELHATFKIISERVEPRGTPKIPDDGLDPFCQRVNHWRIRDALLDGYMLANESLQSQVLIEQNKVLRYIQLSGTPVIGSQQNELDQAIKYEQQLIDALNRAIQHNQARVHELSLGQK
jgi:hypothetical protein